jgi:hypothetical protein
MTHHRSSSAGRCLRAAVLFSILAGLTRADAGKALGSDDTPKPATAAEQETFRILAFVQPYEPIKLGLSQDEGDELFLDFTLSLMFPLAGTYASDQPLAGESEWSKFNYQHFALFFSGTVRGGQYIWGRPSAPVVEKRFNPQLFLRWWVPDDAGRESPNRFVDLIYAHESNGQSITSEERFNEQREIYRKLENFPDSQLAADRSLRSARDAISRGWDYIGVNASWSWRNERHVALLKMREYLPWGLLQKDAEQSNEWEGDGPTHPRRQYDLGAALWRRPVSVWVRYGYNSNLTNYYRRDTSFGGGISIWAF